MTICIRYAEDGDEAPTFTSIVRLYRMGSQSRQPSDVTIERRSIDWGADLAWETLLELGCAGPSLGRPDLIVKAAKIVLLGQQGTGRTMFVNPEFTVIGSSHAPPSVDFIRESRRAQRAYLRHLASILFSARRMKNELKRVDPITRQLAYTGVLIVDGRHVHPKRWPDSKDNWYREETIEQITDS